MRKRKTFWQRLRQKAQQPSIVHIKIQDGRFQIMGIGAWYAYWRDPYHLLLTIPWTGFIALVVLGYGAVNALFAGAYLLQPNSIANARPGSFLDAFFFSVQTIASIGYGGMSPNTLYANALVTVEAIASIIGIAVLTGLTFARFANPTARVIFSKVAVITVYNGVPTLMFRTANQRRNLILEAQLQVYFMRDEVSAEGYRIRRFYDLALLRSKTPSFTLSWTAMHPINPESPLYGETPESLRAKRSSIIVSLSGIDDTVSQVLHTRYTYGADDILWHHQLVDIFHETPDGHRYLDYTHFHDVVPLE